MSLLLILIHWLFIVFVFVVVVVVVTIMMIQPVDADLIAVATTGSTHHHRNHNHKDISKSYYKKILLESFDNEIHHYHPYHEWVEMNDPVMGGQSTGSFHIEYTADTNSTTNTTSTTTGGVGIFIGEVKNVPFLHAPGFIQVRTPIVSLLQPPQQIVLFPDISHCDAFELMVRSHYPNYQGYRMSFGTQQAPHGKRFAFGYKTHFTFDSTISISSISRPFQSIVLPFNNFTDYWDDATGNAIIECNPDRTSEHHIYCPTIASLQNIQTMALWGEGYNGNVSIDIQSISAIHCRDDISNVDDIEPTTTTTTTTIDTATTSSTTTIRNWVYQFIFGHSNHDDNDVVVTPSQPLEPSGTTTTTTTTTNIRTATILSPPRSNVLLLTSLYRTRW